MPQAALSRSIVSYLLLQVVDEGLLGRLVGRRVPARPRPARARRPSSARCRRSSPGTTDRRPPCPSARPCARRSALPEAGIEHVGELAPVALAALQRPAAAVDRGHVGRLAQQVDRPRPTSWRSCSCPSSAAAGGTTAANCRFHSVAVLAQQVGRGEVERLVASCPGSSRAAPSCPCRRTAASGESLAGRSANQCSRSVIGVVALLRADAVDAVRPEQPALGIDQPPLALDASRRGRSRWPRACGPAFQPPYWSQSSGPGCAARSAASACLLCGEVVGRLDLARPVLVDVLAERVDQAERACPDRRRPATAGNPLMPKSLALRLGDTLWVGSAAGPIAAINESRTGAREA